jgi:sugar fermentation stimulation protein A
MTGCAIPGANAYFSDSMNPKRKLRYTLEVTQTSEATICVNTHRANGLVEEALLAGRIPALAGFDELQREVRYGVEKSRIDLLLSFGDTRCYVEVKNATLGMGDGVVAFPDAVTLRGQKHLRELMHMVEQGHRAALIYCVARTDAKSVRAAQEIDPGYAQTLREAKRVGVEVYALKIVIDLPELKLLEPLPVLD